LIRRCIVKWSMMPSGNRLPLLPTFCKIIDLI
jgi:hypothetical protein